MKKVLWVAHNIERKKWEYSVALSRLKDQGVHIDPFKYFEEALEYIKEHSPDLVIMDIMGYVPKELKDTTSDSTEVGAYVYNYIRENLGYLGHVIFLTDLSMRSARRILERGVSPEYAYNYTLLSSADTPNDKLVYEVLELLQKNS